MDDDTCKISPAALALAAARSHGLPTPVASSKSKEETYKDVGIALDRFFKGYSVDSVGRMSTIAAFLRLYFPRFFFVGFYTVREAGVSLQVGPYSGNGYVLACGRIGWGKGLCGAAAASGVTQVVQDVRLIENYISCDEDTLSEIVVPVLGFSYHNEAESLDGPRKLIGVLDIDADVVGAFDGTDAACLEALMAKYF